MEDRKASGRIWFFAAALLQQRAENGWDYPFYAMPRDQYWALTPEQRMKHPGALRFRELIEEVVTEMERRGKAETEGHP